MVGMPYHFGLLEPTSLRRVLCYEVQFVKLMQSRRIEKTVQRDVIAGACLLCSEEKPHHCHRRLVAEYLKDKSGDVDIVHLS
jgi:hypothetical protein